MTWGWWRPSRCLFRKRTARGETARVTLDFHDEQITLEVRDDGEGFEPPVRLHEDVQTGQLGLLGMSEGAELVGGTFELKSSKDGSGTTLRMTA